MESRYVINKNGCHEYTDDDDLTDYEEIPEKPELDYDDDNDGVADSQAPFPKNPTGSVDTDGDGKPDESLPAPGWFKGKKLKEDKDDDNDGHPDASGRAPVGSRKQVRSLPLVDTISYLTDWRVTPCSVHSEGEEKEIRGRGGRRHRFRRCRMIIRMVS